MFIQTEATPNPEVLKFLPGRDVLGKDTREFTSAEEAQTSPLAAAIFDLGNVKRVFFGSDFLTVTKTGDLDWRQMKAPILAAIMEHYTSGAPILAGEARAATQVEGHRVYEGETAQIVAEIKDLLDTRIRPAVAQDGGDILFDRFDDDGTVWLHMRGACSGCPSSSATLKAGVENMLKHYVPEVTRVEQTL
ncbi:MAG TPA: NifU family protein [Caulobacteraceae bacterium]|nr:NifU family protein [Caulobacteraceae bacterium]